MRLSTLLIPLTVAHAAAAASPHAHAVRGRPHSLHQRQAAPAANGIDDAVVAAASAADADASGSGAVVAPTSAAAQSSAPAQSSAAATQPPVKSSAPPVESVAPTSKPPQSSAAAVPSPTASAAVESPKASPSAAVDTTSADVTSAVNTAPTSAAATSDVVTTADASPTTVDTATGLSTTSKATAATTVTKAKTSSASASASSEADESNGLSKGALIGIIVAAVIAGVAGIAWTLFRKWKLRPSNRFDSRTQPIDFNPNNRMDDDDFFEKTLARSASTASADRQRQAFVAELDNDPHHQNPRDLTAGVPEHDFTAGNAAGYGAYEPDPYGRPQDPYGRGAPFDFSSPAPNDFSSPAANYPDYDPNAAGAHGHNPNNFDYPTQDPNATAAYPDAAHTYPPDAHYAGGANGDGYANVQRGPSIGHSAQPFSDYSSPPQTYQAPQPAGPPYDPLHGAEFAVGGRPTGGAEGPYAQAAQYRY